MPHHLTLSAIWLTFWHRFETAYPRKNTMPSRWCSTRVKWPAAECSAETFQKGCPEICPRIACPRAIRSSTIGVIVE
ncbi:hypothetical protein pipiens_010854 [Culex pipiens pipiens]|uniref:Secreted protein n=1 Tax=Culex pipiens pipiens TaxID=38569 RepID=A0ABD1D8P1_CULPP